jgi:hypothetical protein
MSVLASNPIFHAMQSISWVFFLTIGLTFPTKKWAAAVAGRPSVIARPKPSRAPDATPLETELHADD